MCKSVKLLLTMNLELYNGHVGFQPMLLVVDNLARGLWKRKKIRGQETINKHIIGFTFETSLLPEQTLSLKPKLLNNSLGHLVLSLNKSLKPQNMRQVIEHL
jgi:hypothetical protein